MGRTPSSSNWLREHFSDTYVQRAWKEGYRSRAVYKLKEIDREDHVLMPGMTVVDLGAAPGGWTQYASERTGPKGRVIALDVLPMAPVPGTVFIQGDFTEDDTLERLKEQLQGQTPDLVISDMAPNMSGIGVQDQARATYLAELAVDFSLNHLARDGGCLIKTFQGAGFPELLRLLRTRFRRTAVRKPSASRTRSAESYLLGRGLKV